METRERRRRPETEPQTEPASGTGHPTPVSGPDAHSEPPSNADRVLAEEQRAAGGGPTAGAEITGIGYGQPWAIPPSVKALLAATAAAAAPPVAVTALAFYFAFKRQEVLALHFGIDNSVLGFSTQEYLLRGGDALFLVLLFSSLAGLGAIRLHLALLKA